MPSLALSRRQIAQLAVAVAVVLNLGIFALNQVSSQTLTDQEGVLFDLQRELRTPRGRNNPTVLQRDLEVARQRATEASTALPNQVDIIVLHEHIVRSAVGNQVQLTSLALQPPITRDLTAGKFPIVDIAVEARADLASITGFLGKVSNGAYATTVLENLSINQAKELWTVKFNTVVYGKPG